MVLDLPSTVFCRQSPYDHQEMSSMNGGNTSSIPLWKEGLKELPSLLNLGTVSPTLLKIFKKLCTIFESSQLPTVLTRDYPAKEPNEKLSHPPTHNIPFQTSFSKVTPYNK